MENWRWERFKNREKDIRGKGKRNEGKETEKRKIEGGGEERQKKKRKEREKKKKKKLKKTKKKKIVDGTETVLANQEANCVTKYALFGSYRTIQRLSVESDAEKGRDL